MAKLLSLLALSLTFLGCSFVKDEPTDGVDPDQHRVFLTSNVYEPGTVTPDAFCQDAAKDEDLERTYRAIVSTSALSAKDHITNDTGEVVMVASGDVRIIVANRVADLWGGTLSHEIDVTEKKTNIVDDDVFTGTTAAGDKDGTVDTDFCKNWTDKTTGVATVGDSNLTNSGWVDTGTNLSCTNANMHLYCISQ